MARWRQRAADAAAGRSTADPTAACLPAGFPRFLAWCFPARSCKPSTSSTGTQSSAKQRCGSISTAARCLPIGSRTITVSRPGVGKATRSSRRRRGLRDDTLIDTTGVPHSDQLTVTMRMKKVTPDFLEVAVTLDDPVAFERPWSTVKRYARAPGALLRAGIRVLRRQPLSDRRRRRASKSSPRSPQRNRN